MKINKILSFIFLFAFFGIANIAVSRLWGLPFGILFMFLNLPVIYVIKKYVVEKKVSV